MSIHLNSLGTYNMKEDKQENKRKSNVKKDLIIKLLQFVKEQRKDDSKESTKNN